MLFLYLKPAWGVIYSALTVGAITTAVGLIALYFLDETFTKDLDYVEED